MTHTTRSPLLLWLAALTITAFVAGLLVLNARFELLAGAKRIGYRLDSPGQQIQVLAVNPDMPAARAGIRAGDVVVALNGRPVDTVSDYDRFMRDYVVGEPLRVTLRRGDDVFSRTVQPGADFPWLRYTSVLGPCLAFLALGLLSLLHWRQDLRARLLAVLVIAIAVELAVPVIIIGHPLLLDLSTALFFLMTGTQIAVEFHLISLIPARAPWVLRWPRLIWCFYILGLGFGAGVAAAILFGLLVPGGSITAVTDLGFDSLNIILPAWALAVGGMLVYQMSHYPSSEGRQQTALVLVGVAPWIVITLMETVVLLNRGILPAWWVVLGNWALITFPIAVFVAIFRAHLFDLELVARRSLVYGTLTILIIGILYAMLVAAWPLVETAFGNAATPWLITGAALVLGIITSRMRHKVEQAIELHIFPERHALRNHLIRLAARLPVRGKLPLMGSYLADELCLAFRATASAVILVDARTQLPYVLASSRISANAENVLTALFRNDPRLEQILTARARPIELSGLAGHYEFASTLLENNVQVITPLLAHENFIGALCLGEKNHPKRYPREELELFNLLSHHVTFAFENARLAENATFDHLTGLYRREVTLDILERECARAIQCAEPIAVAMIDIDRFKTTNDDHGHLAGDRILKQVAETIKKELRGTDVVGRYGGEEFLAVLPNTDLAGALTALEHVRDGIASLRVELSNEVTARTSVSIGLAGLDHAYGDADMLSHTLISTADRYLYEAKQAGRNRVIARHPSVSVA